MDVVGVRFGRASKITYYKSNDMRFAYKDKVIVQSEDEVLLGEIALTNIDIEKDKLDKKIGYIIRKATDNDIKESVNDKYDAKIAKETCQKKADSYGLKMNVVDCHYSFDRSKLTFYFTADKRVDFRELVKDLASTYRSRIELRQIGVRDHAKLVKHYGSCGQECCCSRHLTEFMPLSIKYAKDQNISLDPSKISGVCGRLMCCLSYEEDNYIEAKKILPKYGQKVNTPDGEGKVIKTDLVKCKCMVKLENKEDDELIEKSYSPEELTN